MDNRKDALRSVKVCRFCLTEESKLSNIYNRSRVSKNAVTLPLQILACVSIEVFPSDGMPTQICDRCRFFMDASYHFKQICRQAEESIMQFLENGEPLEPVTWPSKLLKLFPSNTESVGAKESVKTLVTESGTCVQVQTDSEEDGNTDEKVYNIKIESDGSQSLKKGSSFRVITGDEKIQLVNNDVSTKEKKGGGDGGPAGTERWPCDDCDRTYPLRQLLELHRAQKHRRREVVCHICGDQFFTKYDLMTHQLRHSTDMPFECVACNRKFNRLVLLKRHEKAKHPDLPRYYCQDCPLNFLSLEEFQGHQLRHKQYAVRPHTCEMCKKKFHTNRALSRHKETVHGRNLPYACELCPQRYSTGPKLARHVRTHTRGSEYPCKFCNKVFFKSHHYTRHLRLKHKESGRQTRTTVNDSNNYRCDQCEEAFSTQDDLIYHSAYHATQNLICPLCQEKFDDVDAVTTHIKSHVDSEQYMCDLCELVFTSQERLDIHVASKHEDELREEQLQESDRADDESMEMDPEEDGDEDQNFSLKEEGDHMVVEIKKPNEFAVTNVTQVSDEKPNKNTEGNETEMTYTELATVDTLAIAKQQQQAVKAKQTINAKLKHTPNKQIVAPVSDVSKSVANTSNEVSAE
ncbi:Zinc finger protein 112 [Eumeta japonica]|uniref:Zinc finger protein 112 n=1 Tax=Eumeta variegata TaxID=151549 RepID=A0A4C1ZPB1_EUMVA|nr:Zinc finger protein 112 [Eumeta japonica]